MSMDIKNLRRTIKHARTELVSAEIAHASELAAKKLCDNILNSRFQNIAVYMAAFGEIDCLPIVRRAWLRKKRVFLPVLRKNSLLFAPYLSTTALQPNRYAILEPVHKSTELQSAMHMDAMVIPLVAFDSNLNRVGMGAGYYDRCLRLRKIRRNWRRPRLIGLAYSFQQFDSLHAKSWDVPLDAVITEKESFGSIWKTALYSQLD